MNVTLPFSLKSACQIFNQVADLLEWIVRNETKKQGLSHFLDNYNLLDRSQVELLQFLNVFYLIMADIGMPIAHNKTIGPTQILEYLGLILNFRDRLICIPEKKCLKCLELINILLKAKFSKTTVTVRQIQKTAGTLNFLCNALPAGLPFLKSLYTLTRRSDSKPVSSSDCRNISAAVAGDLDIFKMFLENDHHYLHQIPFSQPQVESSAQHHVFTDAAGHPDVGTGMVSDNEWAQLFWRDTNLFTPNFKPNILILEQLPVLFISIGIFLMTIKFQILKLRVYDHPL